MRHSKGPLVLLFGLFVDSLFVSLSNYLRNWTQANKRPKTLCTQCAQLIDTHYFVLYIQRLCLVLQLTSIRKKLRERKEEIEAVLPILFITCAYPVALMCHLQGISKIAWRSSLLTLIKTCLNRASTQNMIQLKFYHHHHLIRHLHLHKCIEH